MGDYYRVITGDTRSLDCSLKSVSHLLSVMDSNK